MKYRMACRSYNLSAGKRYATLRTKQVYREPGAEYWDRRNAEYLKRYLLKRLERLGGAVTVQRRENTARLPG
jgi:hypothetical protein